MADNVTIRKDGGSPEAGKVIATDDVSSVHYQVVKLAYGASGSATLMTAAAPLPVANDYWAQAALGNVTGVSTINKFGRNPDIDQATELIWATGGSKTVHTAAVTIEVISSDANDTAAGSGAREITVEYIDNNWAAQSGTIATNGTSASTETIANVLRVNRAYVSVAGTYSSTNTGNITVRVESAGVTFVTILAGKGQTETTFYTVPTGKTLVITRVGAAADATKKIGVELFAVRTANDVTTPFTATKRKLWGIVGLGGAYAETVSPPFVVIGPADVFMEAISDSVNTEIEGNYSGVLYTT